MPSYRAATSVSPFRHPGLLTSPLPLPPSSEPPPAEWRVRGSPASEALLIVRRRPVPPVTERRASLSLCAGFATPRPR